MRILLDTNILLRIAMAPGSLPPKLTADVRSADKLFASSISRAEIGVKLSIGKLELPLPEPDFWLGICAELQASQLPFDSKHAARLATLPLHHRDPFDRMIVCQCLAEDLHLATTDAALAAYGVRTI